MSIDILMPALSPTMEEGTLAKWHVKVGDTVKAGDVIAEIETDKATMEVEAVDEGVVEAILVPAGTENVKVNALIAKLAGEGDSPAPAPKVEAPKAAAAAPVPAAAPAPAVPAPAAPVAADGSRVLASPLARRLASAAGLDLKALKGTGPHGRVVKSDVEAAKSGAPAAKAAPASAPAAVAPTAAAPRQIQSLEQMGIPAGSYDLVPLDGMRKTIARRMTESFRDVPHFPLTIDLEIDALLAARAKINSLLEKQGVKVSVNDIVIKAAAVALKQVPEANASYTPEGIAMHHHADIAVAVAVDGGLITPIIRKAETKGLAQISAEMKDLAQRAKDKKLKPEEFQGGTFSISNLGMFGIKSFASIINEPQGAIMSVGAGEQRPVVKNGEIKVATVMTVTLTCDHRVVDGSVGAKFLAAFRPLIEEPLTLIV
ncbi:pyruvate dehydrogenase complex dihydrolipoamide acetyltransferase [Caulobacter vibrioides]|uniref:Acetyltransferase component of pyruvate dehydrogenase complex n=2 Tax=Caulobacter vibrioides TaxID=155892 RepID=Q9A7J4_CAUVC|nr:pyruvate dehydrogenase complex dihydrolipoamide acetyltransferase [Caulobacter vibrioides]YP_002517176.1 pyruvate dehydrogenase complex, dihydrolipoamide acetyltransferase component [Caulobacter vibrioides NA1000]QBQ57123.1 pyruvate dehydrogenase complex dihydrolipoamide acetyltransferase [synthetic Caulobacter sp. 'ethensis']AAK23705.1 pyruvate dehydrogenase complex, E2 component, dihydrolipoamide acetyltransferase [Caulobacter vibrioides CB15]ACL95268.1 pyruvate dehydrogenase complex, dihy